MNKRTSPQAFWRSTLLLIVILLSAIAISSSAPSGAQAAGPLGGKAAAAFLQRHLQLQDEHGAIPPGAYLRAAAQVSKMRAAQVGLGPDIAGIGPGSWTALGPGNVGGRVRSIIPVDANTIFAGSVGGGIWKTTNGGTSWAPVNDFMANLAIGTMVVNPASTSTMYAGTGEGFGNYDAIQGAGIFRSTDSGTTWSQLPSTNNANFNWVNRLAFSPNGSVLLAATNSGIWRSTDGGGIWSQRTFSGALQVAFNPGNNSLAIAGLGSGAQYSTDGGLTWNSATGLPGGRAELGYAPTATSTVYASVDNNSGELYKSTNGGQSYSAVNTGNSLLGGQAWYNNAVWVDPTNANTLVIGGTPLWRSTNGGTNFTNIGGIHADQHIIVSAPGFDGSANKRVYVGNDGGVFTTADIYAATSSSGWTNLNNNLAITQFLSAAGNTGSGVIIGGAQDNGVPRFDGNLAHTNAWTSMAGGDGGFTAADQGDPNYFYSEYVNLAIERSTNAGMSSDYIDGQYWNGSAWVWKAAPYLIPDVQAGNANFIAPFVIDPNNANRLLAGGVSLWRTNDAKTANTATTGPSWASIKGSNGGQKISAIAIAPSNSDVVWVGYNNGDVFMTTNGTAGSPTWVRVDNNPTPLPNRYVGRIAIDASNVNNVYVGFGGFNADSIWHTTNGGTNWSQRVGSGLYQIPAAPVFGLALHPQNSAWMYAATEVGIFASEDG
ncbi:MAG TPA: hypothetical protein VIX58_03145, partial [Anaerolineae bacterium]